MVDQRIPAGFHELLAIEARWSDVIDWVDASMTQAFRDRNKRYALVTAREPDLKMRWDMYRCIEIEHARRVADIEATYDAMRQACFDAKVPLNTDEVSVYSTSLRERPRRDEGKTAQELQVERVMERSRKLREREAKRLAKTRSAGVEDRRDRNLLTPDRTSPAPDEGPGDRPIPEDRGKV